MTYDMERWPNVISVERCSTQNCVKDFLFGSFHLLYAVEEDLSEFHCFAIAFGTWIAWILRAAGLCDSSGRAKATIFSLFLSDFYWVKGLDGLHFTGWWWLEPWNFYISGWLIVMVNSG